jgi:hypothetical protein
MAFAMPHAHPLLPASLKCAQNTVTKKNEWHAQVRLTKLKKEPGFLKLDFLPAFRVLWRSYSGAARLQFLVQ